MGDPRKIKVLEVGQDWIESVNGQYTNFETTGAIEGRNPGERTPAYIQVGSRGMTEKMQPGESYVGRFIRKKEDGMWLISFMAKDNENLAAPQQDGFGGQPSREQTDEPRKPASEGPQRPVAASGGGKGYDGAGLVAAALTGAVAIVAAEAEKREDAEVDMDQLKSLAWDILAIGQDMAARGFNIPQPAKEEDPAMAKAKELMAEIAPVIVKAGLDDRYKKSDVADMDIVHLWIECQKNETQFAVRLSGLLEGGVKQLDTAEDGEGDPDDIPF